METRTVEQVENWSTRPVSDGYAGLRELSDGEFSGAVRAGGAWLFMLNGRVIGVHEGSLDDFEDADGTAYAAPHPSLPLLFSMKEEGGQTQAKYYTNDTPLSEADSTLSDGKFTGYVELSENVLSGDYYVVYYGGRSMSVAFVGASEQVVSGDEAFERAADEVGIYEVKDVDIDVIDVPEPEEPGEPARSGGGVETGSGPSDGGTDRGGSAESPGAGTGPTDSPPQSATTADSPTGTGAASTGQGARSPENDATEGGSTEGTAEAATDSGTTTEAQSVATEPGRSRTASGATPATDERAADADSQSADARGAAAAESPAEQSSDTGPTAPSASPEPTPDRPEGTAEAADEGAAETDDEGMFGEEEQWRETTTIPSLDPDRTEGRDDADSAKRRKQAAKEMRTQSSAGSSASAASDDRETHRSKSAAESGTDESAASESSARSRRARASESGGGSGGPSPDESNAQVEELQSQLRQRKQQVERLENSLSKVRSERDELKRERDALRQEVERLEAELDDAESGGGATGASRRLDRAQAFDGTNLFVRYRSKGEATLKEAAAGDADADDVNANLRLEHHTQFEADDAAVDGRPFEEFLADSFEYRFVSWLVEELLYEIRDTGHRSGLRGLYDAIPKIDRVDLHGSVSAGTDEEDTRQESFDVIARDRMGNPLVVADLNGSRDPTTGEMMGTHVDAATGVAEAHDELAGAFQVTESFFEPEALETAESATSGGLLSREKRESFVKLSRKRGYHLCLVESRSGGFHLNVPEL